MTDLSDLAKRAAATLPYAVQQRLKRAHFARQIRKGKFVSPEPEFARLPEWVKPGDVVLDVGANVGHYTAALSRLVGPKGRVLAVEPMPQSFALLTACVEALGADNITLINAALSSQARMVTMSLPRFDTGLPNFYEARISGAADGINVVALTLDRLALEAPFSLVKIDAEGHEMGVLEGAQATIARDRPILIVETQSGEVEKMLSKLGYKSQRMPNSPNVVFLPE